MDYAWINLSALVFVSFQYGITFEQTATGVRMSMVKGEGAKVIDMPGEAIDAVRTRVGCPAWKGG